MIKLNLDKWNNELSGCSVGLLGFEEIQDEKEESCRDIFSVLLL